MSRIATLVLLGAVLLVTACGDSEDPADDPARGPATDPAVETPGAAGAGAAAETPGTEPGEEPSSTDSGGGEAVPAAPGKETPVAPPKRVFVKDEAAREVLGRAIESMGGDAVLAKVEGAKFSYEGSYETDTMKSPFKSEMLFVRPDRMLWTLDAGIFKAAVGTAGGVSWSRFMTPVGRAKGVQAESIAQWPDHQDLLLVRPLLHREDVSLRMGEAKDGGGGRRETVHVGFGGKSEFAVTFLTKDGKTFMRWVDGPQLHLDGRRGTMKLSLSRPKPFGDITLPTGYSSESYVGEKLDHVMMELLMAVEWNPEVAEGAFAMPKLSMKLDEVATKETESYYGLVLIHEGPYDGLAESIAKAFGLAAQTGVMFMPTAVCVYTNDPTKVADPSDLRTEVIVPLMVMGPPPKSPEGAEVRPIPSMEVASMVVKGPYGAREGEIIGKLTAWAAAKDRTPSGPPRVIYFHNPALVVDEDQISEIQIPVK